MRCELNQIHIDDTFILYFMRIAQKRFEELHLE